MNIRLSLLAAVTAGALCSAVPALAQAPAPAPMAVPAPMASPLPAAAFAPLAPLVIPAPPGGRLRAEMDARNEDLLGMTKAFLKGIGETGQPPAAVPGRALSPPNPVAEAIANGDLAAMLRDINHVHMVVYEMPGAKLTTTLTLKPAAAKGKMVVQSPKPAAPAFDSNTFYENAFAAEGAHRLLFTDADEVKLVMVGFPNKQGFAFAASGGGYVVVERSDGYPDLEILTAFLSHVTTAVVNSQMGKKVMSKMDPSKAADPGKTLDTRKAKP